MTASLEVLPSPGQSDAWPELSCTQIPRDSFERRKEIQGNPTGKAFAAVSHKILCNLKTRLKIKTNRIYIIRFPRNKMKGHFLLGS